MTTLNPDLLDSNTRAAMNRASDLMRQHGKPVLMPELALLALLRMPQSTAYRAVAHLAESRGFTVAELDREVEAQVHARTGRAANFNYLTDQNSTVQMSDEMVIALDEARSIALASGEIYIATEHLLGALSQTGVSTAGLLQRKGVTPTALASLIVDGIVSKRATTTDWVQQARQGQLPPLYYRENLLRDLVTLLALARDPHVILIGEPGSGRRSLVQSLALMIAEGKGPAHVKKVIEVSDAAWLDNPMLAMQVAMRQAENGVLFIANIQRFLGGQLRADLPQAGKDLQKAFVSDGAGPIIIGTTTDADYAERIKPNATIAGRAHVLRVPPATPDECQKMLATLRPQFERNYSIAIAEDALKTATTLAARYVGGAPLPGSAVQVLHRACAAVRATASERQQTADYRLQITDDRRQTGPTLALDAEDVMFAVSLMTGIPVAKLGADERGRYAQMAQALQQRVIGQDEAIQAVSRAVKSARVGLKDPKRPIGSFLFLGPSGVGKTELARALAEFLFGSEDNLVALDMSEYQKDDAINRLIGAPPGYIGFEGGGQLTERILKSPYAVVLFDEVEKAHPRILDILLQVMEEGRLTDGQGRVANFAETVILLTSNLGAQYLNDKSLSGVEARELAMNDVRSFFRPEFINRLDEIVMFNALSPDSLRRILDLMIKKEAKLAQERGSTLEILPAARAWMLAQTNEPHLGARP
ncbi:MAG: AAA family ATPase, partial [Candidatus Roseilinea sp.]|uniref:AAA family ATPase n=1 Tax=Candidatus Roseilinea sp. TaxID=2838777 RepID=UPI004049AA1A